MMPRLKHQRRPLDLHPRSGGVALRACLAMASARSLAGWNLRQYCLKPTCGGHPRVRGMHTANARRAHGPARSKRKANMTKFAGPSAQGVFRSRINWCGGVYLKIIQRARGAPGAKVGQTCFPNLPLTSPPPPLDRCQALRRDFLGLFRAILGPSWAILGHFGANLAPSWTILGSRCPPNSQNINVP